MTRHCKICLWTVAILLITILGIDFAHKQEQLRLNQNLMYAAYDARKDSVGDLLLRGANPRAESSFRQAWPFSRCLAILKGEQSSPTHCSALLALLLRHYYDPYPDHPDPPHREDSQLVQMLLDWGADVNARASDYGDSPLILASMWGFNDTVQVLLAYGADANARNFHGETPLIIAIESSHIALAPRLIEHGAAIDSQDCDGKTVLIRSIMSNNNVAIEWLLVHGASPFVTDKQGDSALTMVSESGSAKSKKIIAAHLFHGQH